MSADVSGASRPPDPGAAAVHLLDAGGAHAVLRRPEKVDLPASVGWGVLVLPVYGAEPELSIEFGDPEESGTTTGAVAGPRWLACADLRRVRHDVVAVRGLLRGGTALLEGPGDPAAIPPDGSAHRIQGVFRMRPLPGRRIQVRLVAAVVPTGPVEPRPGGPARLEIEGTFAR
ncbi:hypothetical protein GCM10009836_18160 [Pseudonocardia ailaonensis]|uniref:Uncharacterized protein n=1 Tax=Pseudonocardia ailaonensis TaxID=367279 RepID=A0ABN2MUP9_9PSEU